MEWRSTIGLIAAAALAPSAGAAIFFDGGPGTGAPPPTLGPYTMTPFPLDPRPDLTIVFDVPSPLGGSVLFDIPMEIRHIGVSWATWSHGYSDEVYFTGTGVSALTMTMPANTGAFYFYAEPNLFGVFLVEAIAQDGTSSGLIPVDGDSGATYFGFYGTGGDSIVTIMVNVEPSADGFAVGEFGIALVPGPGCLALLAVAGLVGGRRRRRA